MALWQVVLVVALLALGAAVGVSLLRDWWRDHDVPQWAILAVLAIGLAAVMAATFLG